MSGLMRHIGATRNVVLPGRYLRFRLAGRPVGWVSPEFADTLRGLGCPAGADGIAWEEAARLQDLARRASETGAFVWRGEAFDVREAPGGEVLAQLDRGALPRFGISAEGVHVNGLVRAADGLHLWVARRSANRPVDPGKLDHLVAGGINAGLDPIAALVKEADEEAGVPEALARTATAVGVIDYCVERPEGLRRDRLHCFDLFLPEDFEPVARDGEIESFALWPIARVAEALRETEDFKWNVGLVLADLIGRVA